MWCDLAQYNYIPYIMWTFYHDVQNNPNKDYVTTLDMVGPLTDRAHVYSECTWITENVFFT